MHGLRARGGFEVDLDWSSSGAKTVLIHSVGGTDTRVRFGSQIISLHLDKGGTKRLISRGTRMELEGREK